MFVPLAWATAAAALGAAPAVIPDLSHGYFPGLNRPRAEAVRVGRAGGPVILIVVDALRPDHLPAYGYRRPTAPNLTGLADEGLVFTQVFANGNWTKPSTASILTGLPPASHGVQGEHDRLADDFVTLAEILRQVGVPTGAVVGNGNAGSAFGLGRGFDFYADTVNNWQGLPSAEQVVELAVPFVKKHQDQPFFLMLFFIDAHDPYHAPAPYEDMFVEPEHKDAKLVRRPHWELGKYSEAERQRMIATYDGAIAYTDHVIGNFFGTLRELGLYDKSTIIVTADHGEAFGEHGVYLHSHHFYDEIVRIPLIWRAPEMSQRGAYVPYLFQTIDLMPTIARAFGATVPKDLPGLNIALALSEPQRNDPRRYVISEFNNFGIRRRMLRSYREKVVYEEPANEAEFNATVGNKALLPSVSFAGEKVQVFDLEKDPRELRDLVRVEGKGALAKENKRFRPLLEILKRHRKKNAALDPAKLSLDAETLKDLRALGYIQ